MSTSSSPTVGKVVDDGEISQRMQDLELNVRSQSEKDAEDQEMEMARLKKIYEEIQKGIEEMEERLKKFDEDMEARWKQDREEKEEWEARLKQDREEKEEWEALKEMEARLKEDVEEWAARRDTNLEQWEERWDKEAEDDKMADNGRKLEQIEQSVNDLKVELAQSVNDLKVELAQSVRGVWQSVNDFEVEQRKSQIYVQNLIEGTISLMATRGEEALKRINHRN